MRKMIDNKEIIKEICLRIVGENELKTNPKLINRITFFYNHVISVCLEDTPEIVLTCINEICNFEIKWYDSNVHNLSLFDDYSVVNCISLFSVISRQLALDKFDKSEYPYISVFLENLFDGFCEVIRERHEFGEMFSEVISEIGINFSYASGHSNIMSLTLYNNMMRPDKRGEY